jgi:hypothetical protein
MTIAICLKVGDGVVLGTDSAVSLIGEDERYFNVYESAEKTINLVKGLPVGMMTYGLGGLRGLSIGSLSRDLRARLQGGDPEFPEWTLDPETYTVGEIAARVKEFFYEDLYRAEFAPPPADAADGAGTERREEDQGPGAPVPRYPVIGFVLAGFSAGRQYPECCTIEVDQGGYCTGPSLLYGPEPAGVVDFWGMPEALNRLVYGWSADAHARLMAAGLSPLLANDVLMSYTELTHPAMPMQEAIDLVRYLAEVTAGYVRFKAGAPTVVPPIDIAVITRHRGFKWVARKHYFSQELNPVKK